MKTIDADSVVTIAIELLDNLQIEPKRRTPFMRFFSGFTPKKLAKKLHSDNDEIYFYKLFSYCSTIRKSRSDTCIYYSTYSVSTDCFKYFVEDSETIAKSSYLKHPEIQKLYVGLKEFLFIESLKQDVKQLSDPSAIFSFGGRIPKNLISQLANRNEYSFKEKILIKQMRDKIEDFYNIYPIPIKSRYFEFIEKNMQLNTSDRMNRPKPQ